MSNLQALEEELAKDLQWYFYDWSWRSLEDDLRNQLSDATDDEKIDQLKTQIQTHRDEADEDASERLSKVHWNLVKWLEEAVPGAKDGDVIGDPSSWRMSLGFHVDTGVKEHYFSLKGQRCDHMRRDYSWSKLHREAPEIFEDPIHRDEVIWHVQTINRGGKGRDIYGGDTGLKGYSGAVEMAVVKTLEFLDEELARISALHQTLSGF